MYRIALPLAVFMTLAACETDSDTVAPPLLEDISTGRTDLDLVDRLAALEGAVDYHLADIGVAADFTTDASRLAVTGSGLVDTEGLPAERDANFEYSNIYAGAAALAWAEGVRVAVVTPPQIAIGFAVSGEVVQIEPNLWVAQNSVDLPEGTLTTTFAVAWVGIGWVGEMRYSDATHTDTLWFNGFVSTDGNLGWWDLYGDQGEAAVVEWIGDGQGTGQFGMAATAGQHIGSQISYLFTPDFGRIDALVGDTGEHAWVEGHTDGSGAVRLADFNEGEESCWAADGLNVLCPAL